MGQMSELHLLSERVLDGETVTEVAQGERVSEEDLAWATAERLKSDAQKVHMAVYPK